MIVCWPQGRSLHTENIWEGNRTPEKWSSQDLHKQILPYEQGQDGARPQ